jgi:serine/threonine protein kinase
MALSVGTRLGPYEILSALGSGGMGEVYKARDARLERTVAIKILPNADPDLKKRFEREAKAIASLTHPHICTLYDVGHQDGTDYLVLEYLEGETLADHLQRGRLKSDEALKTAMQIADALNRAHRAGIIHRDLKPANVMLTKAGIKLLDFGLAKLRPQAAVSGFSVAPTQSTPLMTSAGSILGTLQYMAPEQLEGREADQRSDIWAFGCVLHEMLTGNKAFTGDSQAAVIGAILRDEPPNPVPNQAADGFLNDLIRSCLAKAPDDRVQSIHDVRLQIASIAGPSGVARSDRVRRAVSYGQVSRWSLVPWCSS